MRTASILLPAAVLAVCNAQLAACNAQQGAMNDSNLLRVIVDQGVALAATRVSDRAPIAIDLTSFALLRETGDREAFDIRVLSEDLGREVRDTPREDAIRCSNVGSACSVVDDALFVQLDSLRQSSGELEAIVTYTFSDRRASGAVAACMIPARVRFRRDDASWSLQEFTPLRRC